jgi:hypothetical protein
MYPQYDNNKKESNVIFLYHILYIIVDDNWICFNIHCWQKDGNSLYWLWIFEEENFLGV